MLIFVSVEAPEPAIEVTIGPDSMADTDNVCEALEQTNPEAGQVSPPVRETLLNRSVDAASPPIDPDCLCAFCTASEADLRLLS